MTQKVVKILIGNTLGIRVHKLMSNSRARAKHTKFTTIRRMIAFNFLQVLARL